MLVTKCIEIDMGHRVPNHKSKCRNLHGHRYKIEVGVDDKVVKTSGSSDEGMVIDFSDLKAIMMREIDEVYDHSLVLDLQDEFTETIDGFGLKLNLIDGIPTAEILATHWYYIMRKALLEVGIKIKHLTVWETPTSSATYEEK